jgi:hypothetical protein
MSVELALRKGAIFRPDLGVIEFTGGRRFEGVSLSGIVFGTADDEPIPVRVLGSVRPVTPAQIARRERLPGLVIVPVETRFLHADRDILFSLFPLAFAVEGDQPLDPARTLVLPTHGSVDVDDNGHMVGGGQPCFPAVGTDHWVSLDADAVATIAGWVRGPNGEKPDALVNLGCFSSTPVGGTGPTFNEELAATLSTLGIAVYGPPHAGVVTAANWLGGWKSQFGQKVQTGGTVADVPIKFHRILPKRAKRTKQKHSPPKLPDATRYSTVVVTNDCALASEISAYSPDFSATRQHEIDRSLME